MTLKLKSFIMVISAMAAVALSSCVKTDDPSYFYGPIYEFADVTSITDDAVTYTVQQRNSLAYSMVRSLDPSLVDPEKYPVGSRVLIVYNITRDIPTSTTSATNVQLTDIFKAHTPSITKAQLENCNVGNVKLALAADPYRAGRYLNIRGVTVLGNYTYSCTVDENSLEQGTPHIYVAVTDETKTETTQEATSSSRADVTYVETPISVNLNPIWDKLVGHGVTLHLKSGDEGKEVTYTLPTIYEKNNNE